MPDKKDPSEWISVDDALPSCDDAPGSFGVEVEIRPKQKEATAFFGRRIDDNACFYKYGARVEGVTHWRAMRADAGSDSEQKAQVDAYVEGAVSRDKEVDDLVAALELLLSNWPQHRDGMDHDVLPVGVKSARLLLSKRK
jgi:hypothetical protein